MPCAPPRLVAALAALAAAAAACGTADVDDGTGTLQQAAVYGADDREDVYAVGDLAWRTTARRSIVALVPPHTVDASDPRDVQLIGDSLQDTYGVCASEPFAEQPAIARCSGTLIDVDLVLTAGHCVAPDRFDCVSDTTFVFNFTMADEDTRATITVDDVYGCKAVVAYAHEVQDGARLDYAIVQLDRPVAAPRAPVSLKASALSVGASVAVIGFPSGLPAKIDSGGAVTDARGGSDDYFVATTDTFGGSSGSGVFDADHALVGVLVRGADDWNDAVEDGEDCLVRATYGSDGDGAGEHSTYAHRAVDALCADGWDGALCGGADGTGGPGDVDGDAVGGVDEGFGRAADGDVSAPVDGASCAQMRGGASTFAALLVVLAALRRRRPG